MATRIVARGRTRGGCGLGGAPFFLPLTDFPLIAAAVTVPPSIGGSGKVATDCTAVSHPASTLTENAPDCGDDIVDVVGGRRAISVVGCNRKKLLMSRRLASSSSHLSTADCGMSRSAFADWWRDGPSSFNPTTKTTFPFPSPVAVRPFSTSVGRTSAEERDEAPHDDDEGEHGNELVATSVEADFFGETVTFLRRSRSHRKDGEGHEIDVGSPDTSTEEDGPEVASAMAALDDFILAVVTGGQSADGGGDEEGVGAQAAHSSATTWSALLRKACDGLPVGSDAPFSPMLAAAAVAPLFIQGGGLTYVRHLDDVIRNETDERGISLLSLARRAASMRRSPALTPRERHHLEGLHHLISGEPCEALTSYTRAVQFCPGDCLALSLALQLSHVLGNARAALRAGASVATYWEERGRAGAIGSGTGGGGAGGGHLLSSIPGHTVGTAYVALGLAAGGRHREAEMLAERCLRRDSSSSGGVASHALSIVYEAEGRTAEGASLLVGYDGVKTYEHCGFLFLDARLGGIGARFVLDRDGMAGGDSNSGAVRLYDEHFDRVLTRHRGGTDYPRHRRAPRTSVGLLKRATRSMFGSLWFGGGNASPISGEGRSGSAATSSDGPRDVKEEECSSTENSPCDKEGEEQKQYREQSQEEWDKQGDSVKDDDSESHRHHHPRPLQQGDGEEQMPPRSRLRMTPPLQLEDVFARLPPTPQFLSDATLVLLRLTLAGVVEHDDARWSTLRVAWERCRSLSDVEDMGDGEMTTGESNRVTVTRRPWSRTLPLADAVSALLIGEEGVESGSNVRCNDTTGGDGVGAGIHYCDNFIVSDNEDGDRLTNVRSALAIMGRLMCLGVAVGEEKQNDDAGQRAPCSEFTASENDADDGWKMVVHHLASAAEGRADDPSLSSSSKGGGGFGWDQDVRPILEHSLCHAASLSNDYECYCIARAVCSEGVTLRPNCPEVWWRYGVVLDELGDDVAAQDAREASRMFGGGAGGVGAH